MKKIYKQTYFDKQAWILENFDKLSINNNEALLLLFIEHCNKNNISLSHELIANKLNLDSKETDKLISDLLSKHYLSIINGIDGIEFNIDGIFEFDVERFTIEENADIFSTIEAVFGRLLTTNELQKVNDLLEKYDENTFLNALRKAEARRNMSIAYVEGILRNNE